MDNQSSPVLSTQVNESVLNPAEDLTPPLPQ
jgi:hypothetical protein